MPETDNPFASVLSRPALPGTAAPAASPSPATFPRLSTASCACSASSRTARAFLARGYQPGR